MIEIRKERSEDFAAVYQVNSLAFEREAEANLVEKLRRVQPTISFVAVLENQIVGHIFFSPVTIEPEDSTLAALGLAPMAVLPEFQNQGIGSKLVRAGLKECADGNFDAVFVLGHPNYYPRFGFSPAKVRGFSCEYPVPGEVFMLLELRQGALDGKTGLVKYRPEFSEI